MVLLDIIIAYGNDYKNDMESSYNGYAAMVTLEAYVVVFLGPHSYGFARYIQDHMAYEKEVKLEEKNQLEEEKHICVRGEARKGKKTKGLKRKGNETYGKDTYSKGQLVKATYDILCKGKAQTAKQRASKEAKRESGERTAAERVAAEASGNKIRG